MIRRNQYFSDVLGKHLQTDTHTHLIPWASHLLSRIRFRLRDGVPGSIPGLGKSTGEWVSLIVQLVKNLPAMRETWV